MNLNPKHRLDNLNNPKTFLDHIEELKVKNQAVSHNEVLLHLLDQVDPINFQTLAYPDEYETLKKELEEASHNEKDQIQKKLESLKICSKHYIVLSIDHILSLAKENNWALCKNNNFIYAYNGTYWAEIDIELFQKFLGEAAEKMGVPLFSARHFQFREQLFKQFLATAYLPYPHANQEKVLINLLNGTFEISHKEIQLREFDDSDFLTYQLPFPYDPEAEAPIFEEFLNRVLPNKQIQKVLAEYLGYVFIRNGSKILKEEKALILHGTGANGKSVFFEIVNSLLGSQNVSNFSLQSLTNETGYYRAKIGNKLLNYASEINGKLETALFKQIVSGEPVEARLPYGQPFILRNYAKLIFNSNELPKDVEQTAAFFRRFLIIPFEITIPEEEQDKNLHTKIIENELSGVFNWVLEGLKRLLEQKRFTKCEAIDKAVNDYKLSSDSVKMFLTENQYTPSLSNEILLKIMYQEYKVYCLEGGFRPCNSRTFTNRIKQSGFDTHRKSLGYVVFGEKKYL
ncbi:DNA primase family protein [Algoriphagus limi]|uniref:Phage/plasmid primase, P4 family n=1 Tax=Algoriphagus limi TaxID=2975273 RepID=A0ABT2G0W8_9BACT|nr:phage/plasmid primase, P4 family [Algoriphagus limi]MCS5488915.1 phage/plasmid primase, P4 family [Algoriphagus limi]